LFVVVIAGGLSPADRARAIESGPPFVEAESSYPSLMETTGFADIDIMDLTADYAATLSKSIETRETERGRLEELLGAETFAEGQADRRRELEAISQGLLQRHLITGLRRR
jgi:hypothetical protein